MCLPELSSSCAKLTIMGGQGSPSHTITRIWGLVCVLVFIMSWCQIIQVFFSHLPHGSLPLKLPAVTKFVNLSLPIKCQKYLTRLSNFSNQYMDLIGFFKDYLISVSDSSWLPSELTSPPPLNMSHKCTFECRFSNQTFAWGGGLFGLLCPNHIHINSQLLWDLQNVHGFSMFIKKK